MAVLGRAGTPLDIKLSESPNLKDPMLNGELQLIHNALHLLSQYMTVLRTSLESDASQDPSVALRFRRNFWAIALQDISIGAVVSNYANGIVNGVLATEPKAVVGDSGVTVGSTGTRDLFEVKQQEHFIALSAASAGQLVNVGVGPGVLKVTGANCGQLIWGVAAKSCNTHRDANTFEQYSYPGDLVGNGGLYLANITGFYVFPTGGGYKWEGYWISGFPHNDGGTYYYSRAFLYPIGVCIKDEYVLFFDYKRSDPLPPVFTGAP